MDEIYGGAAVTPMLVPDWNQTNSNRSDYIKNKPEVANALKGYASGNPIVITDVSPVPHEISVQTDIAEATVTKCGKNLFDPSVLEVAGLKNQADGYYSGRSNLLSDAYHWNNGKLGSMYNGFLPNTQYAFRITGRNLNFGSNTNGSVGFYFQYSDGTRSKAIYLYGNTDNPDEDMTISFVSDAKKSVTGLHCSNSYTFDILVKEFQLEVGGANTYFEPYVEPTTFTADGNGVVRGIIGNGESMTLIADCNTITAEYNKDTNKVIDNLINAIISLGGNV